MRIKSRGDVIRRLREEQGMTSAQLAAKAGIDPGFLSRIENQRGAGSIQTRTKLAEILGVTLADITDFAPAEPERVA